MSALELRARLGRLAAERLEAADAGLAANDLYMRDLDQDLTAAREAYVGVVVTEIATLRGELFGPQLG